MDDLSLEFVFDAVKSGNGTLIAAVALMVAVWAARKYLGSKWAFLKSDAGGVILAFAGALAGGVATALGAGEAFSWALVLTSAKVAFTAMGGYSALRKLLAPVAGSVLSRVGLGADPVAERVEAAAAGSAAVTAAPGKGLGESEDVP